MPRPSLARAVQHGRRWAVTLYPLRANAGCALINCLRAFVHAADAGGFEDHRGAGPGRVETMCSAASARPMKRLGDRVVGPGADQCRGAGPHGLGVRRSRHRACRVVCVEERPHRMGPAYRRDRRRGGNAGRPDHRRIADGGAQVTGIKLILAGDDRQLASIERGGLFTELKTRHGSAEITEITRQQIDWQRQAARDLAEGRFAEGR